MTVNKIISSIIVMLILFSSFTVINLALAEHSNYEINNDNNKSNEVLKNIDKVTSTHQDNNKYYILQFIGPIKSSWKEHVTNLGGQLFGYYPEFAFLVNLDNDAKASIQKLPFITSIHPYGPELKFSKERLDWYIKNSGSGKIALVIELFVTRENIRQREIVFDTVALEIKRLGGEIISSSYDKLEIQIPLQAVQRVTELEGILWLEPAPQFRICNDVAAGIIKTPVVWENLSLDGTGQVVTICDTGLDNGSYQDLHEDFRGRLEHAYAIGRSISNDWSDSNIHNSTGHGVGGHGTHVAGSVVGGGNHSAGMYKGMAYNASLVFQSVMTNTGDLAIPIDIYNDLFVGPYSNYNSRIHTNSWEEYNSMGEYTTFSSAVDEFIWDFPDQVIVFAAGNALAMVSAPGTAKNCITVGASESLRSAVELPNHFTLCNDINQRATFSSYGTDDKRLKPDILTPGTGILSTRSSFIDDIENHYWEKFNDFYAYSGGTSMATPIAAGLATLIRQYYTDIENIKPSAALIKATLLNGAVDMVGAISPPDIPNDQEGWGRVNIENSIYPKLPGNLLYVDNKTGLTTDGSFNYTFDVVNNSVPLNITLVWSDWKASPSATVTLVNDLHLNITHFSTGKGYKGNVFNNSWSSSNDTDANIDWDKSIPLDGYDNRNNVESVRLKTPDLGRYKITVRGYNVPTDSQPFAIAITGGLNPIVLLPPKNVMVETVPTGNALNLSWEPVLRPTITGYEIHRKDSPTGEFKIINVTNSSYIRKFQDTGLIDGKTYYYKLRTKNIANNVSNFTAVIPGVPQDSVPPWVTILEPLPGTGVCKNQTIKYQNDTDCVKIIFSYYNDTDANGLPDDDNSWQIIGEDTTLNGTFWWNTTLAGAGPGNQPAVILGAEGWDEKPNKKLVQVPNIRVDNFAPGSPTLEKYKRNPTNETSINLTGIAESNATVYIYSNGNFVGMNTTNYTGKFKVEAQLFEGLNVITARAIDYMGNGPGSPSSEQNIILDTIAPIAKANGNVKINEDTLFTFNASNSYDTNPVPEFNFTTDYTWNFKLPNGTYVELEGIEAQYFFNTMGNYTITLTLRDSARNLGTEQFWLLVKDNTKPIPDAGSDFEWDEDIILFLNASNSTDNDPNFNFTGSFVWNFLDYNETRTEDGKIQLVKLYGKNVSYIFMTPGTFIVTLNVTDAAGNWDTNSIEITIRDTENPIAIASSNQMPVILGRTVTFDASQSSDNDPTFPETGNFTWSFKYIDEDITLYGIKPTFRFQKINVFTITLLVRDKWNNSATDELVISVDPDLELPTVLWSYPADNSRNVRVTTVIKVKLSEELDIIKTPLNLTTFQLTDSQYRVLDGTLQYDNMQALILFIPKNVLNLGESYTLLLLSSLMDLAGNRLDGNGNTIEDSEKDDIYKIVFTTTNITTVPFNSQSDVPNDTEISAQFGDNISKFTLENSIIKLSDQLTAEVIQGELELNIETYSIMLKPTDNLGLGKEYSVELIIRFYLIPAENISMAAMHREFEVTNTTSNLTTQQFENLTELYYTWTFKTKKRTDDKDGELLTISTMLLLGILVIIIIIIIIIFIFITQKRREKTAEERAMEEEEEFDEDYEDEYKKVYGDLPTKPKSRERPKHKGKGKRKLKHKPRRREKGGKRPRKKHKTPVTEELEEDFYDLEEEYITDLDEEPETDVEDEIEFDEEEVEVEFDESEEEYEEDKGELEAEDEEEIELAEVEEELEQAEEEAEVEDLEEIEEVEVEELEELDELEELEELEEIEE